MKLQPFFNEKRVKYCLTMLCSFLFLNNSFAQVQDIGVKLGASYSTVKNTKYVSGIEPIYSALVGFYYKQKIGAKGDSSKFLVGLEGIITQKGYRKEIQNSLETVTYKQGFIYANVPVYVGYQLSPHVQVIGGVEAGILLRAKLKGNPVQTKASYNFKGVDFGLLGGIVITPLRAVSLDIRVIRGLSNLTKYEYFDAYGNSNGNVTALQNFSIQASVHFNISNL
jgi:hypothetical protein